jgi:hypothetical protein
MHAVATFDLHNADDYEKAYEVLEKKLGFLRTIGTTKGKTKMPSTTVARDYGAQTPDTSALYDAVTECLSGAGFKVSRLMVMVVTGFTITVPQ